MFTESFFLPTGCKRGGSESVSVSPHLSGKVRPFSGMVWCGAWVGHAGQTTYFSIEVKRNFCYVGNIKTCAYGILMTLLTTCQKGVLMISTACTKDVPWLV